MADDALHSSWHPALRSHNSSHDVAIATQQEPSAPADHDDDADFFDRIPADHDQSIVEHADTQDPVQEPTAGTVQPSLDRKSVV